MAELYRNKKPRAAVIGAGVAGLNCAARLAGNGWGVVVFEKSRGIGGRLATRRTADGLHFDHGAQFITARTDIFRTYLGKAMDDGAQLWRPKIHNPPNSRPEDWFVGAPMMNSFLIGKAADLDIRFETAVQKIHKEAGGWAIETSLQTGRTLFDAVISTAPAPQTAVLAHDAPELSESLGQVRMAPCWAVMMAFETPYEPGFDLWRSQDGDLSLFARNTSKPDRKALPDCWVAHAGVAWSERFLEWSKEEAQQQLLSLVKETMPGPMPAISYAAGHRWRYARVSEPYREPFVFDHTGTFLAAGDWCLGSRVEDAFLSAAAAADAILKKK